MALLSNKVFCGKNVQCKGTYPSVDVLGCGLCRQVSFGMTYVEFNFIEFILSQYLATNQFKLKNLYKNKHFFYFC